MQHHEVTDREVAGKSTSDRGFGLTFAVVFTIIATALWLYNSAGAIWWLVAAAAMACVSFAAPSVLAPLNRLWMRFALLLAYVINPIVLTLLFYAVMTPYGLLTRILGKSVLRKDFDKGAGTYWLERDPPGPPPPAMLHQF
jgi:hypothetical protein